MSTAARFSIPTVDSTLVWRRTGAVRRSSLLDRAGVLAGSLPGAGHVINLCQSREAFLTGFVAALLRGQTTLLPPNRGRGTLSELGARFETAYALTEEPLDDLDLPQHRLDLQALDGRRAPSSAIRPEHVGAIAFTSGSTGLPRAHPKTWRSLVLGAELAARRLPFAGANILATVPPQHMYGLETSVMVPLMNGAAVHDGRPLLPADLADALGELPPPRILVATPIHLRACVEAGCRMPPLALIISATAPLAPALAERAEAAWGAPVREIYGCTEAGSLASRRTVEGDLWSPYDGVHLLRDGETPVVAGGHLPHPVELADVLEADPSGRFRIRGRHADMVSVAGKRASLADLTRRLTSIAGVEDGVFLQPDGHAGDRPGRLAALFVSASLTEREVLDRLHRYLDPVFLPRPILRVGALPRNELGKLPHDRLQALLRGRARDRDAP